MERLSLFLVLMFVFAGFHADAQTCSATLCGVVTDADTGKPVPFAQVVIGELNTGTITDEDGKFHFHNLCDDTYTVVCQHIGCEHIAKQIKVKGNVEVNFQLHHEPLQLAEILVSGSAVAAASTQAGRELTGVALDAAKGQTLGDALRRLPGVNALTTGSSIVKPVIQGLHSNRILMLNNGVRHEGQQWGLEHAPEIDPYTADEVKVVMGANSVRYGTDAIGGVILVEPKPLRERPGLGGEANLAGFSNGRSGAASLMLDGRLKSMPLAMRLQGTLRRGGNVRTPDYFLENTGLAERNFSAALGWERKGMEVEAFYSYFYTTLGIFRGSHIGNLTDLQNAIERGRPLEDGSFRYTLGRPQQRVAHHLLKLRGSMITGEAGKLSVQYARQFNHRREFDAHRRFGTLPDDFSNPNMEFEITTHTADLAWEHKPWRKLSGTVGAQWIMQVNTTDRGGLIPNFDSQTLGVFWIERWRSYPFPLQFEAGVRYDARRLNVVRRGNDVIDKSLDFNNISGTMGAIWQVNKRVTARLHFGSAWRAPGVNELYSDGVHHGSASYEKGRDDLRTERAFSSSLALDGSLNLPLGSTSPKYNFAFNVSFYRNYVRDFIFLKPRTVPVLTIRGAFPAFDYDQTDARMMGFDGSAEWQPVRVLALTSAISLLRARNISEDEPLVFMPADRFRNGIRFMPFSPKEGRLAEDAPYFGLGMQNVLRQRRVPENQDYAPPPEGYTLFDLEAGSAFLFGKQKLHAGLAVHNLFNTAYRDYLNRLRYFSDEMGRNFSVRMKLIF